MTPCKLIPREDVAGLGVSLRMRGKRIAFTNGCFDLLHVGHTRFLAEARSLGNVLVVGVNTDDSIRRIKGKHRPWVPQEERAEILTALDSVDHVVLFDETTPVAVIEALRPHVACKGGDYRDPRVLPEAIAVASCDGEFRLLGHTAHRSSSSLIENIVAVTRELTFP